MKRPQYISVDEAFAKIPKKEECAIVTAMAVAEPTLFFNSLHRQMQGRHHVTVYCANPSVPYPCFTDPLPEDAGRLELRVMFLTRAVAPYQGKDRVHYVPQHLSQWVSNLEYLKKDIDVFWGTCSPPDARGIVNLGPSCCYESELVRMAKLVILEVDDQLPETTGSTQIPMDFVDYFIKAEPKSLPEAMRKTPNEEEKRIGGFIADLIPDRATIQFGIGGIPDAIGKALLHKKDLGVHTEMMNDTLMELFEQGVITGRYKTIWPGKMITSFVYGSQKLYQFVHQNPLVELHPAKVVNDPYRIGRNFQMISVNTAIEVDITGQVVSESIGHLEVSGIGGAFDTHSGAQKSKGGRGIIGIVAKTKKGESKVVMDLKPGAKVSIGRNDIDTIVTEYGVASLRGKSVSERAKLMIAIAAPEFREKLYADAKRYGYI